METVGDFIERVGDCEARRYFWRATAELRAGVRAELEERMHVEPASDAQREIVARALGVA